jgi:hypothetical protein
MFGDSAERRKSGLIEPEHGGLGQCSRMTPEDIEDGDG